MKFLLVEDNQELANAVSARLCLDGHVIDHAAKLEDASAFIATGEYDLILLDIMLPDGDGRTFLKEQRANGLDTPVIVLTARSQVSDRIGSLDLGADDYVTKPFDHAELEARCRAVLRRKAGKARSVFETGGIVFDPVAGQLAVQGEAIKLRNRELRLLELLINAPGQIFSKQKLADRLFSYDDEASDNAIEVYIGRLRKHLEGADLKITTLRGLVTGWIMTGNLTASGSLRNRLVMTLIGGGAILALLLFFAVRNYATLIAQQGQDSILRASVTSILDAASIRDGVAEIDIPYASFSMLSTPSDDRVFYAIYRDDGFLSGYPELSPESTATTGSTAFDSVLFKGEAVRTVTATRTLIGADGRTLIRVTLAQTQDALSGTLEAISRNAALLGAGFFALATVLSFWATSSTIGQLMHLTNSVTRRGPQDLSPFDEPVPTEMLPLVTSLNSLMGRLDHSLCQSEDFIAEPAHRIRTPLATVRSYAEATLQRVDKAENRQAMRSMVRAIDESSRAASQLLDHAMITFRADHLERQDIDLIELVRDLVMRLTPIAEMKDLELTLEHDDRVSCSGDPVLIQNAVRNLIDNALKYAPPESVVHISVTAKPRVRIAICDSGQGFPVEEVDVLATRFKRGQNAEGTIGSGLGLTIAQDVAEAHGGQLLLSNRAEGGACATLYL